MIELKRFAGNILHLKEVEKHVKVKERNAVIIELQDQVGVTIKVWATSVLARNLEENRDERENKVLYIISKGKKISSNNQVYYEFAIKAI